MAAALYAFVELAPVIPRTTGDPLRVGFVALVDCAPLVVAKELGIFRDFGLDVILLRQPGWASVRDKVVTGELDASQAVSGLPFAISHGLGGAQCACLTALLLNTHGDAITVSNRLWEAGARTARELAAELRRGSLGGPLVFGVVHPHSSHNFLLHDWLRSARLVPGEDVQIVIVPPPLMARNLAAGNLDGFCVGEPWNTASISGGNGHCIATSAELCPHHPEKNLLVTKAFAERRSGDHQRLIGALLEACAYCDRSENHPEIARLLALPGYVNVSEEILLQSLCCEHVATPKLRASKLRVHHFSGGDTNRPTGQRANWILQQMNRCGVAAPSNTRGLPAAGDIFRADIYDEVVRSLGALRQPALAV
ncbi:CmpA/NrtA family ABC transporter substrate-binding protein [soil metagenome]